MRVDKELVQKIATNARLELTEKELEEFLPQLKEVLKVFSTLDEISTDNTEPSFHPIKIENIFRDDTTKDCLSKEQVFENVKNKEKGYFKGPKAI